MARAGPATAPGEGDAPIAGGGRVGASLAVALWGTGVRVLLVESMPFGTGAQPSFDERTTALGNASRRIFEGIGVWPAIAPEAAAIRSIHVSEAGRFGFSRLTASEQGVDAFGYIVANRRIGAALWQKLASASAPQLLLRMPARVRDLEVSDARVRFGVEGGSGAAEPILAHLVVAADGAHSQIRAAAGIAADVEDYDQVAVVANVATDRAHEGRAFERFTREGPLAVLPLHDGTWAVIWACRPAHAARLLSLDEAAYLARLQAQFGWRAGRFVAASRQSARRPAPRGGRGAGRRGRGGAGGGPFLAFRGGGGGGGGGCRGALLRGGAGGAARALGGGVPAPPPPAPPPADAALEARV